MAMTSAVVLGGSAGIGRAIVDKLVGNGYRVGVVARGAERLQQMQEAHPDKVSTATADVADYPGLERAVASLVERIGVPEVWVNCAMLTSFSPFAQMEVDEFARIINVTFLGQVHGTRLAMQCMAKGNIINLGSGLTYRSVPLQSAYCAAKHALNGFTSSVRSELLAEPDNQLHLTVLQLPAVNTPQFDWALNRLDKKPQPAPPVYQPETVADGVLEAIASNAREILMGKQVLKLVFADMVLPDYLDRKLARAGVTAQKSARDEPGGRPHNLYEPVALASRARGSFAEMAGESVVMVDGDKARKMVFLGSLAVMFALGLASGLLLA